MGDFTLNLTGTDKVIANLNKKVRAIENRSVASLWVVGLQVRSDAQALTPVETGHLRNSAYVDVNEAEKYVEIGYSQSYAPYVHECYRNARSGKVIKHPMGQWKFLETALKRNAKNIVSIIQRMAHV